METKSGRDILHAVALLRMEEVVALPTETVYGLAGNAFSERALKKIFEAKNRPADDPLIVHVKDKKQVEQLVTEISSTAEKLMEVFWPGPLTILFPKHFSVPNRCTSGLPFVAIRQPAHPMFREVLSRCAFPLAAPSANPFGYVSPTSASHVLDQLHGRIPYVLDGGPCRIGIESTLVRLEGNTIFILRSGGISPEDIKSALPECEVVIAKDAQIKIGAGRHYAPFKPIVLTHDPEGYVMRYPHKKLGVISLNQAVHPFNGIWKKLGDETSLDSAAQQLYSVIRELDQSDVECIVAELFPDRGIGIALNDRLERAAEKR
jgi:L-threonylcarbamoyladenylate synthase